MSKHVLYATLLSAVMILPAMAMDLEEQRREVRGQNDAVDTIEAADAQLKKQKEGQLSEEEIAKRNAEAKSFAASLSKFDPEAMVKRLEAAKQKRLAAAAGGANS